MSRVSIYRLGGGDVCLLSEYESKVVCPHCTKPMPEDEFIENMDKADYPYIRKKCKGCKRFIGVTLTWNGEFVGCEL